MWFKDFRGKSENRHKPKHRHTEKLKGYSLQSLDALNPALGVWICEKILKHSVVNRKLLDTFFLKNSAYLDLEGPWRVSDSTASFGGNISLVNRLKRSF